MRKTDSSALLHGTLVLSGMLAAACARGTPIAQTPAPVTHPAPVREAGALPRPDMYRIIPLPAELTPEPGALPLSGLATIALSDPGDTELEALAEYAAGVLRHQGGVTAAIDTIPAASAPDGSLTLLLLTGEPEANPERYALVVGTGSVTISAPAPAGLFYGLQTLRQLLPPRAAEAGSDWTIPAVEIRDQPRFAYRGMHLDVGRHFFPVAFIKKYIDLIATYKMNTFHWHLTEDQGWRIEIKRYPRLTEVGSCRKETILDKNFDPYVGDGIPYCGFYTQDEIRDVVAYARSRYVTVIPEIEMPGHSVAALAAYPELACTEGPFEVATRWGVTQDIYCPTEKTFAFLENVLTEVMDLFPSRYIHIGGDEAPKQRWEESPIAQEVIRREGLADEHELQSYFIRRIEKFLLAHGRRLIGWDEILEGGLAPEATVMSWRGMEGGIEAARQGHDVIMTPGSHVYFDHYQGNPQYEPLAIGGYSPLEHVYEFEPVPEELTPDEAAHVLGAQGNVWTEYMQTAEYVEYMVVPRLLALSEVVWSPKGRRDWESFTRRLPAQFRHLDAMGISYRIPGVVGLEHDRLTLDDHVTLSLEALMPAAEIRYTTDGSDPTRRADLYRGPLTLPVDDRGVRVTARIFLPNGRFSAPRSARFRRTSLRPAETLDERRLEPGIRYSYYEYEGSVRSVDRLDDMRPVREGVADGVALPESAREERFGLVFTGYLRVPEDGIYTFFLASDDGSRLSIGGEVVVDHDGLHGGSERSGMIALHAGYHPVTVRYFQAGGGRSLRLEWTREGETGRMPVAGRLFYMP